MADLYIANPSKQDSMIHYILAERPTRVGRPHPSMMVGAGQQVRLAGLDTHDIEATVDHLRRYGARDLDEVKREVRHVALIYSEKEITYDNVARAAEHNIEVLEETGKDLRQAAAIVADQSMLNQSPEGTTLKATNVEMVEMSPKDRPDTETISETRVVKAEPGTADRKGKQVPNRKAG